MSNPVHSKTMYNITYLSPGGNRKWVIWQGKDPSHACRSWNKVYPTAQILSVKPYVMKWTY